MDNKEKRKIISKNLSSFKMNSAGEKSKYPELCGSTRKGKDSKLNFPWLHLSDKQAPGLNGHDLNEDVKLILPGIASILIPNE